MKYIIKDCFGNYVKGFKRPKDLEIVKGKLKEKLWKLVYNGELCKSTYRTFYEYSHYGNIKELNEFLNYELGIKIFRS